MPGAGGIGGFAAQYLPEAVQGDGVLQITQGVAVSFKDTLVMSGGTVTAHPDLPSSDALNDMAAQVTALADPGQKATVLAAFQWAPAEHAPWIATLEPLIEQGWGGQHEFFLNKPRWEWLGAAVAVDLKIGERVKLATDHMALDAFKTPADLSLKTWDIDHEVPPGSHTNPFDQRMRLSSSSLGPKEYELLKKSVLFEFGSSALTPDAKDTLDKFVAKFDGDNTLAAHQEVRVDLIGHASASGEEAYNQKLSQARADTVRAYLHAQGFHNVGTRVISEARGEREADPGDPRKAADQRVDLLVDGGARMVTALHEFGHAFGLEDEYGTVGDPVAHDQWAREMSDASGNPLPGAVTEHNGGIMSLGNQVRPRHYATFHHALQSVTAQSPWALGPHKAKWQVRMECGEPSPPGDWNVPGPDDGTRSA